MNNFKAGLDSLPALAAKAYQAYAATFLLLLISLYFDSNIFTQINEKFEINFKKLIESAHRLNLKRNLKKLLEEISILYEHKTSYLNS